MGRPLKKDVNGVSVIRSFATSEVGIKLEGYFTDDSGLNSDYHIIKQRGAKTFVVASQAATDFAEGESITNSSAVDPTKFRTGKLVSGEPAADGEIRMRGYNSAGTPQGAQVTANLVAIAKITKRVATDFSGNRYTWFIQNDSSADYIVLTPIV